MWSVFKQGRETATYNINSTVVGMSGPTMTAVRVHRFGGPEVLSLEQNVPLPDLGANQVRICIFGGRGGDLEAIS